MGSEHNVQCNWGKLLNIQYILLPILSGCDPHPCSFHEKRKTSFKSFTTRCPSIGVQDVLAGTYDIPRNLVVGGGIPCPTSARGRGKGQIVQTLISKFYATPPPNPTPGESRGLGMQFKCLHSSSQYARLLNTQDALLGINTQTEANWLFNRRAFHLSGGTKRRWWLISILI